MRIVDLGPEHLDTYLHCLEPHAREIEPGIARKRAWYERMSQRGLVVKLAIDDDEQPVGMIQALPIEESHVLGHQLHFVHCIWVHGHKEGVGNRQGRGMGKALLAAAEEEARRVGSHGMAAWGLSLPIWMKASWFKKRGYRATDHDGIAALVWKPFDDEARPPRWMPSPRKLELDPERVTVTCFEAGWCTLQNANCARARRVAAEFGDDVVVNTIDTSDGEEARRWRQADGIYVDHVSINNGPPLSDARIRRRIRRRIRARSWRRWLRASRPEA